MSFYVVTRKYNLSLMEVFFLLDFLPKHENIRWLLLVLESFIFYYPLAMSIIWIVGAVIFYRRRERNIKREKIVLDEYPLVSVLVPAFNEELSIKSTLEGIFNSEYPNLEVIVIDDGSKDKTPEILQELSKEHPSLRVLILKKNSGKPIALRSGLLAANGTIICTIDGDAYLDKYAISWLASHFIGPENTRVGAVTGNPRVRNRTTLLAKIQVGEYSSIIGMIKRTQRLIGKVLTVSGVIVAFNRNAILDVGLWDIDMITDDINITWKLERNFWDIRYEPNALCWILVPETLRGLWRQRVRWAQGGGEVIRRHRDIWLDYRQRRLWPVFLEYVLSVIWSYAFGVFFFASILHLFLPEYIPYVPILPMWRGSVIVILALIQFTIALIIDRRYEDKMLVSLFWVIWYPFIYWIFIALTTMWATPKALFKKMGKNATWISPDRGLTEKEGETK